MSCPPIPPLWHRTLTSTLLGWRGVLDLLKSVNELSLDLHKSGNGLSLDLHKSGNELSLNLHKSSNELSLDLHKSGNKLSLDLHINESPKCNSSRAVEYMLYYSYVRGR